MPDPPTTSPELLRRLANSADPEAWAELIRRFAADMYRAAYAVTRNPTTSDDAVQEALLHLRHRAGRFRDPGADPEGAVRRWLRRLASNAAAHLLLAERRRRRREAVVARELPAEAPMHSDEPVDETWRGPLAVALAELPAADRQVILLRHFDGLDHQGLASALGCQPGAARMRLQRAHARLRDHLARLGLPLALAALALRLDALTAECTATAPSVSRLADWQGLLTAERKPALSFHLLTGNTHPMTHAALLAAALLLAVGLTLDAGLTAANPPPAPPPPTQAETPAPPTIAAAPFSDVEARDAAVLAQAAFACALLRRHPADRDNLVFSPLSLHTALAMTMAGAAGGTRDEMRHVLQANVPDEAVHRGLGMLLRDMAPGRDAQGATHFELQIANRLWPSQAVNIQPGFTARLQDEYGVDIQALDFRNETEASRQTINRWVSAKTRERIPELLEPSDLRPDIDLVLTNSLYFQARWPDPWNAEWTSPKAFLTPTGEVEVDMMLKTSHFAYRDIGPAHLVALPCGGNDEAELLLLVPKDRGIDTPQGLRATEVLLDPVSLGRWRVACDTHYIRLSLPRLDLAWREKLAPDLVQAGMPSAFNNQKADFSHLTVSGLASDGSRLCIREVIHQVDFDLDEAGVSGAAATAILGGGGGLPPEPLDIACDRPFVLLVRHARTGAWLFLGRVMQPGRVTQPGRVQKAVVEDEQQPPLRRKRQKKQSP